MTHIIAKVTGYQVGEFIHTSGDLHIYHSHFNEDFYKMLNRQPLPLPKLEMPYYLNNIDQLVNETITEKDFRLMSYQHHGKLSFPVAI